MPVYETVQPYTLASLLAITSVGPFQMIRGTWIDKARNDLMEAFTEDYMLMLDSDMVFDPADVKALLLSLQAHPSCGAISGHYVSRDGQAFPVCDWRTEGGWLSEEDRRQRADRGMRSAQLEYVDSFGAGFLAISQEAKQKLGSPWFKTIRREDGEFEGEDTFFCKRLQEAGFKPSVHFGIPVGHCGLTVYRPDAGKE